MVIQTLELNPIQERKQAMATTLQPKTKSVTFTCSMDCMIGAYSLQEGEPMKVTSDGRGKYYLKVSWADGDIGPLTAVIVNKLAGKEVV
jgi:hypothetical protein